ncbi:MAG: hypothetical protein RR263_00605, partial [Oscillospiraceae bacterium]
NRYNSSQMNANIAGSYDRRKEEKYGGSKNFGYGSDYQSPGYSDVYDTYMNKIENMKRQQEEAQRKAIEAGVGQLEGRIPLLKQQQDSAAREAYTRKMQSEVSMPQQMSALGYTGGLSETSMTGVNAGYQNNQNDLLAAYENAVAGVNGDIAQLKANGDLEIANNAGQYDKMILDVSQQQAQQAYQAKQQREQMEYQAQLQKEQRDWETQQWNYQTSVDQKNKLDYLTAQQAYEKKVAGGSSSGGGSSGKKMTSSSYKTNSDYADDYSDALDGKISKNDIVKKSRDLIAMYGIDGYNELYNAAPEQINDPVTKQGMSLDWRER